MTETIRQNIMCSLLIGISIAVVLLLTPKTVYEPHGIISTLSSKPVAPVIAAQVQAYNNAPAGFKETGYFSVELLNDDNPVAAQQQIVTYARNLAAQIGAKSVVVEQLAQSGDMWYLIGSAGN